MLLRALIARTERGVVPSRLFEAQRTVRPASDTPGIHVVLSVVLPEADGADLEAPALVQSEAPTARTRAFLVVAHLGPDNVTGVQLRAPGAQLPERGSCNDLLDGETVIRRASPRRDSAWRRQARFCRTQAPLAVPLQATRRSRLPPACPRACSPIAEAGGPSSCWRARENAEIWPDGPRRSLLVRGRLVAT